MGGRGGLAAGGGGAGVQMGHRHHHHRSAAGGGGGGGGASADGGVGDRGDEESDVDGGGHKPNHHHRHHGGFFAALTAPGTCCAFLLNLLGLDRFTRGRAAHGLALGSSSARSRNPFDLGMVRNCRDFWTMGKELGVEYGQVYDVPLEGFEEAKRRRAVERGEFEHDHESGGARSKSLLGKLVLRMGVMSSSSARGYEPLSQV
ncbi:hypothetical protein F5I97DRAFT_396928 [Phlebopus sp. FC_14]|nr:hypothetical protein F5I97DRAFT_396928 [Phlebopus sp. FC_14]